jgi:hypothetical protein
VGHDAYDWLTEAFSAHREFTVKVHHVKGIASRELYVYRQSTQPRGFHLLKRLHRYTHDDGLHQIFAMIHFRERVYYGG